MNKLFILLMVMVVTLVTSVVMADPNGEAKEGRLFLFQKCNDTLKHTTGYDSSGCPTSGNGPWPIFFGNDRYGRMDYNLWGPRFTFIFVGKRLEPRNNYTLIYYPDDWPGDGLICLGSGRSTKSGNILIKGNKDIGTSLPAPFDANFNPNPPSGAVGAKIWLVLADDVDCGGNGTTSKMKAWNPTSYLLEYNLIVYERRPKTVEQDEED